MIRPYHFHRPYSHPRASLPPFRGWQVEVSIRSSINSSTTELSAATSNSTTQLLARISQAREALLREVGRWE